MGIDIINDLDFAKKKLNIFDEKKFFSSNLQSDVNKRKVIYLYMIGRYHSANDISRLFKKIPSTIHFALFTCCESLILGDDTIWNLAMKLMDKKEIERVIGIIRTNYIMRTPRERIKDSKWNVLVRNTIRYPKKSHI